MSSINFFQEIFIYSSPETSVYEAVRTPTVKDLSGDSEPRPVLIPLEAAAWSDIKEWRRWYVNLIILNVNKTQRNWQYV